VINTGRIAGGSRSRGEQMAADHQRAGPLPKTLRDFRGGAFLHPTPGAKPRFLERGPIAHSFAALRAAAYK
jgi:hypothetical protein